jgi:hypothetical protein
MGAGVNPPCASSDGGLETSAPQCQTHGASLGNLSLAPTLLESIALELLTAGVASSIHKHVTGGLEQLLGSHDDPLGSCLPKARLPPMHIVCHPTQPPATTTVPPFELSTTHQTPHLHGLYYDHNRERAGVSLMMIIVATPPVIK